MNADNFFAELKRRNVYKVAVAYAVVGWLIIQISSTVLPTFHAPEWVVQTLVVLVALGFPIALVLAWAFEATPEGIKRTEVADAMPMAGGQKKHAWMYIVVIGGAISVALFFLGRYTVRNSSASPGEATAKSIAVLPFDNLSRDPDNAYFAEGVQDEILTRLAKVADLKVISRTSTQRFKSAPSDLRDIAKQLGVMNILEGSVQKSNDQVRVNVQLINAITDAHLWAEIYDRKLSDIFAVQSDIAKTVADTLQAKLTGSEKQMIAAQATTDTTAYEFYHKGRSLWEKRTGDNIPKAIAFYEQAIAQDPNYALAYAGLAGAHILSPFYAGADRRDALPKAKEAALKALRLDPNLAEAHAALGKILFGEVDLAGATREYKRAIELKPNDAGAHHWFGNDALAAVGRFEEAIAEGRRAVELDPLSIVINADLGVTFYYAHRYEESARQFRKTLDIDPTSFYTHYNLGTLLQVTGDLSGAIAEYEKAKRLGDNAYVSTLWAAAKAHAGDKDPARRMLNELDQISSQHRQAVGYLRTLLYVSLNNKEEALRGLEQGFEERDGTNISVIKVDPLLDSLHGDPRFEALAEKIAPAREFGKATTPK